MDGELAEKLAEQQAASIRSRFAALHEPDMIAGGWSNADTEKMGLASVNSSIGASWNQGKRLSTIDAWAEAAAQNGYGSSPMNVILPIKTGR